jgi:glycosyltransferase involved in cell wall biosynthesis
MQKISACLVVYNEEQLIERCLKSIKEVVDEIVVIHDGECHDRTLEICKKYNAKIFIKEYIGVAEPHRPFSFEQATGDWILQIDADEFLSNELKRNLRSLAERDNIDGFYFRWRLFNQRSSRYCCSGKSYKAIFFRKSKLYFLGVPHFSLSTRGKIEKSELVLCHVYKKLTLFKRFLKYRKWAKIQASLLRKDFWEISNFQADEKDWEGCNRLIKKIC